MLIVWLCVERFVFFNSSICFSGKIAGRPDELPVGILPVCIISCINNWHVSLVIRKWYSNSPDKYAGIVTSKYPFTRINSLRIKQATAARRITSSLLSRIVQLIVSQSSCSKAAKMFKKSAIFNTTKFHPACPALQSTWPRILESGRTRSIRPAKIPKIWTGDFCWMKSAPNHVDCFVFCS